MTAFESGRAAFPRHVFIELVLPKAEPADSLDAVLVWEAGDADAGGALADVQSDCGRSEGLDAGEVRRGRFRRSMW